MYVYVRTCSHTRRTRNPCIIKRTDSHTTRRRIQTPCIIMRTLLYLVYLAISSASSQSRAGSLATPECHRVPLPWSAPCARAHGPAAALVRAHLALRQCPTQSARELRLRHTAHMVLSSPLRTMRHLLPSYPAADQWDSCNYHPDRPSANWSLQPER